MESRCRQVSIKDLNQDSIMCTVIVRVLRVYSVIDKYKKPRGIEMILMDSEGSKILAVANVNPSNKLRPLLDEGHIHMISNFKMQVNGKTYKSARINNPFKIELGMNTKIALFHDADIPVNGFNFVMFKDIPRIDPDYTLDVVGKYCSHTSIERVAAWNNARKLELTIQDHESKKLVCVLWESYADELLNFVQSRGDKTDSFTIALQFVAVSKYKEVYRVTSTKGATILLMDQASEEISSFLHNHVEDQSSLHNSFSNNQLIDWFPPNSCKSIEDIIKCREPGVYTTVAEVIEVDDTEWYFPSCNHCNKRVWKTIKAGDSCPRCYKSTEKIVPIYKVKLQAYDGMKSTYFVLFEKEATALFGKSSADMIQSLSEDEEFPEQITALCDKTWIFKIHVDHDFNIRDNKAEFTIKELSTDEQLISEFNKAKSATESNSVGTNKTDGEASSVMINSNISLLDKSEETTSDSLYLCNTPQKRSMPTTMPLTEPKSGDAQCSANKIPKKEK